MISVVVPIKNEEENIFPLAEELERALRGRTWELIFVDDGSDDQSRAFIEQLQATKPHVRLVAFTRNFGQSSAFDAGFKAARGPIIVTLDGDLQNDPSDIPALLQILEDGADLVVGWRVNRKDTFSKRLTSKLSNYLRRKAGLDHVHDTGCSLKAYRKSALDSIKLFHGLHRFLPALFVMEGFIVKELPVHHRPRTKGTSKYHFFNRNLGPIIDMLGVAWMARRSLRYKLDE